MELADLISPDLILTDLKSQNRWQVIEEMVDHLVRLGKVKSDDRQNVVDVLKKREQTMSTGIGFGVGLPHASTNLVPEAIGVLGRSQSGIVFDALDNQPVFLVLLFLVPIGQFQRHLHTLSNIAKMLHRQELLQEILKAPDNTSIYNIIKKYKKEGIQDVG